MAATLQVLQNHRTQKWSSVNYCCFTERDDEKKMAGNVDDYC